MSSPAYADSALATPSNVVRINDANATIKDDSKPTFAQTTIPSPNSAKWQALSLFSGCGGLDVGFLQEGVFSRVAHDIDAKAVATYNQNLPDVAQKTDLAKILPSLENSEVLLAGAPCQGFSTVGKRLVGDPRNALLMRVADAALKNRSRVIIVENVPAAVSGLHRFLWEALEDRLRLNGYNVRRILLEGEKYGIAQRRKRLFLLGWIGSDCIRTDIPIRPAIDIKQALSSIEDVDGHDVRWPTKNGRDAMIAPCIPSGHKLSNVRNSDLSVKTWSIPSVYGKVSKSEVEVLHAVSLLRRRARRRKFGDGDPVDPSVLSNHLSRIITGDVDRLIEAGYLRWVDGFIELSHTYNGKYRRLAWQDVSPTVDTRFGRADLFLHPEEHRGMTPREAARIQGFPDSFKLLGSRSDQFVQIGNAVPPPMASALGSFVREAILKA